MHFCRQAGNIIVQSCIANPVRCQGFTRLRHTIEQILDALLLPPALQATAFFITLCIIWPGRMPVGQAGIGVVSAVDAVVDQWFLAKTQTAEIRSGQCQLVIENEIIGKRQHHRQQ